MNIFWSILLFGATAVFGFIYGKKAHLNRLGRVLYSMKLPADLVEKACLYVSQYNKITREAKKEATEAYKKSLVDAQLEKMKKEVE